MYKTQKLTKIKNNYKKKEYLTTKNKHNHPVYVIFEYQVSETADDVTIQ